MIRITDAVSTPPTSHPCFIAHFGFGFPAIKSTLKMKFSVFATLAALVVGLAAAATQDVPLPSPQQAVEAVQQINAPAGVMFTGVAEPIKQTISQSTETAIATATTKDDNNEQWLGGGGWGGLGWGGWGNWGGWGGFGPYRFGYSCGGLTGWAYPLGYWNAFGAGLWGGGCGMGTPYGGLFYC